MDCNGILRQAKISFLKKYPEVNDGENVSPGAFSAKLTGPESRAQSVRSNLPTAVSRASDLKGFSRKASPKSQVFRP